MQTERDFEWKAGRSVTEKCWADEVCLRMKPKCKLARDWRVQSVESLVDTVEQQRYAKAIF